MTFAEASGAWRNALKDTQGEIDKRNNSIAGLVAKQNAAQEKLAKIKTQIAQAQGPVESVIHPEKAKSLSPQLAALTNEVNGYAQQIQGLKAELPDLLGYHEMIRSGAPKPGESVFLPPPPYQSRFAKAQANPMQNGQQAEPTPGMANPPETSKGTPDVGTRKRQLAVIIHQGIPSKGYQPTPAQRQAAAAAKAEYMQMTGQVAQAGQ